MRITKTLSVLTLTLLACQSICGFYLINNPPAVVEDSTSFHIVLGVAALVVATTAVISVFRNAEKSA
jgi:hypothetical protein